MLPFLNLIQKNVVRLNNRLILNFPVDQHNMNQPVKVNIKEK